MILRKKELLCIKLKSKFESIPFYIYGEAIGGNLRSNLGIISRPRIICDSIWGSFSVWGSFTGLYRSCKITKLLITLFDLFYTEHIKDNQLRLLLRIVMVSAKTFTLLFNLYVNDLAFLFNNILSDPFVLPNGTKLSSLFYADDLIILSRSKLGLQNCLNSLSSFCNSWMLKINPKKTKIMIFQKSTNKCDYTFHIGNELIDIVQDYTYLGTRISSSGNFTLSLEHLRQKALHAFFSLRRHTDFSTLKPSLACKIFDAMIQPILTYNSEVWGAFC